MKKILLIIALVFAAAGTGLSIGGLENNQAEACLSPPDC